MPAPPVRTRRSSTRRIAANPPNPMSESFQYITRPTSDGTAIMTGPSYRGTKTKAELTAEIAARLGSAPVTIDEVIRIHHEVVIDWTTAGWKIEAYDALIGFRATCGGSSGIGDPEDWNFDTMKINLSGSWGPTGEARAAGQFSAEKVGEQSRVIPVFSEVYDSESKTPNHYVIGKGLTVQFSNRRFKFDTAAGCRMRFQKGDGTFVNAAGYPYVKGATVVCTPPTGLTGSVNLEATALINGALRTTLYAFPLT